MSKLPDNLTLTDLEKGLGIKQPTISMRLKRLEKYGYIVVNGRMRELRNLGRLMVDITNFEIDTEGEGN